MVLSIEEYVFPVEYVFQSNRYTDLVLKKFAGNFPETPVPHRNAIRRLIEKFRETGSMLDAERSARPSKLNDKKFIDISDSMLRSVQRLSERTVVGRNSFLYLCYYLMIFCLFISPTA
jgi:hypothetical protein